MKLKKTKTLEETKSEFFEKVNKIDKILITFIGGEKENKLSMSGTKEDTSLQILQIGKG